MKRLTKSGAISQKDINELMEISNENQFNTNNAYYKLKHYEDLEEQGLLLKLPCKIGEKVWGITIQQNIYGFYRKSIIRTSFDLDMLRCIGKTIFLSKEEAVLKLRELKEK